MLLPFPMAEDPTWHMLVKSSKSELAVPIKSNLNTLMKLV